MASLSVNVWPWHGFSRCLIEASLSILQGCQTPTKKSTLFIYSTLYKVVQGHLVSLEQTATQSNNLFHIRSIWCHILCKVLGWYFFSSSEIASCDGTMGTVMCHLHLMRPCCAALGLVLIWGLYTDWLRSLM